MPFSGEASPADKAAMVSDQAEVDTAPQAREAATGQPSADATQSPGLLAKIKRVMPFGDEGAAKSDTAPESAASDTAAEDGATEAASASRDEAAENDEDYADEAQHEDNEEVATAPADLIPVPPAAPTSFPLDNQLSDQPAPTSTAQSEHASVDVPAAKPKKTRGFFARLFGRDRPEATADEPDAREHRKYRDLSDPESN
jgi:hypothetical protein